MNLSEQQFGGQPWGRAVPHDKDGNSLYPQSEPNYDSTNSLDITSPEHFAQVVKRKTAKRYDMDSDTYKTAKVDRWQLHRPEGSTHYPAGWTGGV